MRGKGSGFTRIISLLAVLVLVLAACGGNGDEGSTGAGEEPLKVALLTPGPISDKAYNFAASLGLEAAKEKYGLETALSENVAIADIAETMRGYARDGYDVIIGHGGEFGDAGEQVAAEFPDVKFIIHNAQVSGPNLASSLPGFEQSAFLAGMIAGRMSKTGKVGTVGYAPIPAIVFSLEGFKQGAEYVNPDIGYNNVFIQTLTDLAKAREAALSLISGGADVLMPITNGNGVAVLQAAEDEGVYAVGFAVDQSEVAPKAVITSHMINFVAMIELEIGKVVDGEFVGDVTKYGLDTGVVNIAPPADFVPQEVIDEVEEARALILSGELVVEARSEPSEN